MNEGSFILVRYLTPAERYLSSRTDFRVRENQSSSVELRVDQRPSATNCTKMEALGADQAPQLVAVKLGCNPPLSRRRMGKM